MDATKSLRLQERRPIPNTLQRASDLATLCLLISLVIYRLLSLLRGTHGLVELMALLCETWFCFLWTLYTIVKWNLVSFKTYPPNLLNKFDELPSVDMFVTTADPKLEPPIATVNTVLSLLAVEYPVEKLACYVSDDGGSLVTFYSLVEASKFAKVWVSFCKKYDVAVRAPSVYFSTEPQLLLDTPSDFPREWKFVKGEHEKLKRKVEAACENPTSVQTSGEFADFSNTERGNHPSIVKVIRENKDEDDGVPHLIYVSREKRPKHPHHFKAGAMNVLTRVSGVMTNAPFMLNVDCDMFANNPSVILHGMCLIFGFENEVFSAFVQAPQEFHGGLKDDPFGNQLVVLQRKFGLGVAGQQGPFYAGTGCIHRRKIIYGSPPDFRKYERKYDVLSYKDPEAVFGTSRELLDSASEIISGKTEGSLRFVGLSNRIDAAKRVASCTYEFDTCWGNEIGWVYGSMTEDVLTGLRIHSMGWRSVYLLLDPPAFLGSAPTGGPESLTQHKRWATGLLEVLLTSKHSPILATITKSLTFRQFLGYLVINVWALRSVVELCYTLLPAYCLLANASIWPKASDPGFIVAALLFICYNTGTLLEYLDCGLTARAWWNNQRMQRIYALTSWLFGFAGVLLKLFGISETIFEVTRKDQQSVNGEAKVDPRRFTFDSSPMFVSGTAVVLVNVMGLAAGLTRMVRRGYGGEGGEAGMAELFCSAWVVASLWPFVRGLFGKGSYGIPWATILKAAVLAFLFLQLCK